MLFVFFQTFLTSISLTKKENTKLVMKNEEREHYNKQNKNEKKKNHYIRNIVLTVSPIPTIIFFFFCGDGDSGFPSNRGSCDFSDKAATMVKRFLSEQKRQYFNSYHELIL